MRLWERALRRAHIPLAYSEGFNPHPRLSLAAPLAVGVTSEVELLDLVIRRHVSPHWFRDAVSAQLPAGMEIIGVSAVALVLPSLQSQVRFAEYQVTVETEAGPDDVAVAISGLLSREQLPWHHHRDSGRRDYDLRALIDDIWCLDRQPSYVTLGMRLRCDSAGSGRPEQVSLALGFPRHPQSVHRTRLILATS